MAAAADAVVIDQKYNTKTLTLTNFSGEQESIGRDAGSSSVSNDGPDCTRCVFDFADRYAGQCPLHVDGRCVYRSAVISRHSIRTPAVSVFTAAVTSRPLLMSPSNRKFNAGAGSLKVGTTPVWPA